jgi:hypothetical protein
LSFDQSLESATADGGPAHRDPAHDGPIFEFRLRPGRDEISSSPARSSIRTAVPPLFLLQR